MLEKTKQDNIEINIEENWFFVSKNIKKVLNEVNKRWWIVINMQDFEKKKIILGIK